MTATATVYPLVTEKAPGFYARDYSGEGKSARPDADWIAMDDVNTGIPTPTAPAQADDLLDKLVQSHLARSVGPGTEASQGKATRTVAPGGAQTAPPEATDLPIAAKQEDAAAGRDYINGAQAAVIAEAPANTLQQELAASTTAAELDALLSSAMDADEVVRANAFSSHSAPATLPLVDSSVTTQDVEPIRDRTPFEETKAQVAGMIKIAAAEPAAEAPTNVVQAGGEAASEATVAAPAAETQPKAETAPVGASATPTPDPNPETLATSPAATDAGVSAEEGSQLAAVTASETEDDPSPQTHLAMRSRGFVHDLALMMAQLVDMPFAGIPAGAKGAGALIGALLAIGGAALLIVAGVSK